MASERVRGDKFSNQDKTGLVHLGQRVSQVDPYNELSQAHTHGYTFAQNSRVAI